jgi:hypothetical protein
MSRSQTERCKGARPSWQTRQEHSVAHVGNRRIQMTNLDKLKTTIRRNKFLGIWASEKLGLRGPDAEAYANALAVGTLDPKRSDVFSKVRKDFDAAGVIQSDQQILQVMNEFSLQAGQMQATGGSGSDGAAVMLARNLTKR